MKCVLGTGGEAAISYREEPLRAEESWRSGVGRGENVDAGWDRKGCRVRFGPEVGHRAVCG